MIAVKMPNGSFVRIGEELEVFSDDVLFAKWLVKDINTEKRELIVDHIDPAGNLTPDVGIPLNMWEGAEIIELTTDDINKDPNLAFRFRKGD